MSFRVSYRSTSRSLTVDILGTNPYQLLCGNVLEANSAVLGYMSLTVFILVMRKSFTEKSVAMVEYVE